MESVDILKSYSWYLPAHIALWREQQGEGVDAITELIVMNHPEAVAEQEQVDMEFLMSLVSEDVTPVEESVVRPVALDAIESLRRVQPTEDKTSSSMDLIDKFLELKDLRITPPQEDEAEVVDLMWEAASPDLPYTAEDDLASEELARIYLNQKLYKEASDIYNRLFLLYSEKSVYFATQIENIDKILEKSGEN